MWNIIRSMYESVLCCISAGYYYTDPFESPAGVNQGCLLSPKLFCLFINEVTEELRNDWRYRYKCVMCVRVLSSSPYQLNACDWLNYLLSASFGLSFAPIVLDFVWSNKEPKCQNVIMSIFLSLFGPKCVPSCCDLFVDGCAWPTGY